MTKKPVLTKIFAMAAAFMTMTVMCGLPDFAFASETGVTKEETVYVVTDSTGTQQDVIVSDHLINKGGVKTISDKTNLSDVENVKGEETFKQDGENLTWDAEGKGIYYQGKSADEIPVSLDVTYRLDGKVVSGSELQGKSGNVEIKINYENDAEYEGTTVPFIVMTGMIITDESFKDVKIDHGKVIDDGEKLLVVGMAAPGLAQTLDIGETDLGIGSSVTITGTADEFAVEDMMTVVTNSVFEDVDTDKFGDLDYDDEIAQLDKGAKALVEGSEDLYEGLNKLDKNMPAMTKGITQLDNGAIQLRGTLKSKMNQIGTAVGQLHDGTGDILSGMKEMKKGLDEGEGTAQNPGAINALDQVAQGLDQGVNKANDGSERLSSSATDMDAVINGDEKSLKALSGSLSYAAGKEGYKDPVTQSNESLNSLNEMIVNAGGFDAFTAGMTAEQKQIVEGYINLANNENTIANGEYEVISNSSAGASALYGGLSSAPAQLQGAATQMKNSATDLDTAANAVTDVENGLKTMSSKLGAYDKNAKKQETMIGGMTVIDSSLQQMQSQIDDSVSKSGLLTKAMNKLVNGTGQLKKGSKDMSDGVDKLDNGSKKLSKGMSELYEQGIKKIVDLYQDDLKGTLDSVDSMMDAGKGYKTFTRLPSGMDGNVKFIYKTDMTD